MAIGELLHDRAYLEEKRDLPILRALIERYAHERPFEGATIVFGHLLVWNSIPLLEALWRGGADVVVAEAHPSPAAASVVDRMRFLGVSVLPVDEAVRLGEWFLDVGAVLGRARRPRGAAEVTRTGVLHYLRIGCPVVSADDCRAKRIEGFFGTGDGFLRAWRQLRPDDPIAAKKVVQFGYGKIGRGVAHRLRAAGVRLTVADIDEAARTRARLDGMTVIHARPSADLETALTSAQVIVAVTGIPSIFSTAIPVAWLRRGRPILVNLGAEDEFGPAFRDDEILGGRSLPLNFHLARPTENRYVDAPLAAHLLAMESLLADPPSHFPGIHPLPPAMDAWVLETWRKAWPDEDLRGIGEDLGLK